MGQPFMPWQHLMVDVACEIDDEGLPVYREIVVTVPRQSGKTTLFLGVEVQRCIGWAQMLGAPQNVVYSAQTGADARKKLLNDQIPILERHKRTLGIAQITRANGNESVRFGNGSKIELLASGADAGHGRIVDAAMNDEIFADDDMRRDQAMIPAMATRPAAQAWNASTMGTPDSVNLNAKVEKGRLAVEQGRQSGICYVEFSADPGADPEDPKTWLTCMPALGHTIGLSVVKHAFDSMPLGEFRRSFLNIPTLSDEQKIPASSWSLVLGDHAVTAPDVFGLDCNPDRTRGGIVAVQRGPIVAVSDYEPGTGWLVRRARHIWDRWKKPFVVDGSGPAAAFIPELEREGLDLIVLSAGEMAAAAGVFFDHVVNMTMRVRRDADLNAAVAAAATREQGDRWTWSRKASREDICLLVAASAGVYQVDSAQGAPVFAY